MHGKALQANSGEKIVHDVAVDVGQAEVAAHEAVGQLLVIEAELVQPSRLQVMHVDGVLGDV